MVAGQPVCRRLPLETKRDQRASGGRMTVALSRSELLLDGRGESRPFLANAIIALRHSPEFAGVIAHDAFAMTTTAVAPPPWEVGRNDWCHRTWTPQDDLLSTDWLQHQGIRVGVQIAQQAVEAVAHDHSFHPVEDYLGGLQWDGTPRVDDWMARYLGADQSPYVSAVGRAVLIAAAARIRVPGCKVDTVPIIEGRQGIGKSSGARTLFEPWFTDEIAELGSKDAAMQTRGAWLIEIAELDSMSRAEVSRVKAFVSRSTDRFRPPYG